MATPELLPTETIAERIGDLVRIPSVNPLQAGPVSGDEGEVAMSAWLAERAADLGADVTTDEVLDGRENVYARFEGQTDRTIVVDVHMDTVGVEHMTDPPFDGRIEDGRVYGRGSVDTKASLAIVLSVIEEMQRSGERLMPTVNVVGTVAEEVGGLIGAGRYAAWLAENNEKVDQMIVAEPTNCAPVYGHKGGVGMEVTVHGHACHSSQPHLGVNAISGAGRIVDAIDAEQARIEGLDPATEVGNGSVAVLTMEGGVARNIIPPHASMYIGRRVAPGEDPDEIFEHLSAISRAAAEPCAIDISLESTFGAFYQSPDSPLIRWLAEQGETDPGVVTYGSNALQYGATGAEIVVFGPGSIDQAHQAVEWIDIDEVDKAARLYRRMFRS